MSKDSFLALKKKKAIQYFSENKIDKAEKYLKQVCQKSRQDAEAWYLLGLIYGQKGSHSEAERHFKHVIHLAPDIVESYANLAVSLNVQAKYDECVLVLDKFLIQHPNDIDALVNISIALLALNTPDSVIEYAKRAASIDNNNPAAHEVLASAYGMLHLDKEAAQEFEIAIKLNSSNLVTINNYAKLLLLQNDFDRCIEICEQALRLDSSYSPAIYTLSSALIYKGKIKESLEKTTYDNEINTSYLFYLNYDESISPEKIFIEHKRWGETLTYPKKIKFSKTEDHKRIRVGYVSPDFKLHSVAFFLEPLLQNHNKEKFEIFCYSNVRDTDKITERFQSYTQHWRDICRLSNQQVVNMIREDKIDILVDLSGHTEGSRINIFIEKPAPIQITYLGYPSTTGIKTIDYRFVDNNTDPLGFEKNTTEELVRIPDCFLCYSNDSDTNPDRKDHDNEITFGSFNHLPKINDSVIETWAEILNRVNHSKLMLKNKSFSNEAVRESYFERFATHGIKSDRIILVGRIRDVNEHLNYYNNIDIALDTFPYNGTTTTCEALWMKTPVICFSGDRHASRVSSSILKTIGLDELVADDRNAYIDLAVTLANNSEQLKNYHSNLRKKMLDSPLCDGDSFTKKIEHIYQELHQNTHNINQN